MRYPAILLLSAGVIALEPGCAQVEHYPGGSRTGGDGDGDDGDGY
jgi:hypothetical protein